MRHHVDWHKEFPPYKEVSAPPKDVELDTMGRLVVSDPACKGPDEPTPPSIPVVHD